MDKKKIIIYVAIIAIVVILAIVVARGWKKPEIPTEGGEQAGQGTTQQAGAETRKEVTGNVVVPSATSTNVAAGTAIPTEVVPVRDNQSVRKFSIEASGNKFTPSNVTIYKGDTMQIFVTAVDKDYDFTQPDYGYSKGIKKGATEMIAFDGTAEGVFTFYCKACGGPASGPKGTVTVMPKK